MVVQWRAVEKDAGLPLETWRIVFSGGRNVSEWSGFMGICWMDGGEWRNCSRNGTKDVKWK